jgi:hypothetical protein
MPYCQGSLGCSCHLFSAEYQTVYLRAILVKDKYGIVGRDSGPYAGIGCSVLGLLGRINRACFDKILLKNPNEILLYACALMKYWAGLYPEDTQQLISSGVDVMMKTTMHLLGKSNGGQ